MSEVFDDYRFPDEEQLNKLACEYARTKRRTVIACGGTESVSALSVSEPKALPAEALMEQNKASENARNRCAKLVDETTRYLQYSLITCQNVTDKRLIRQIITMKRDILKSLGGAPATAQKQTPAEKTSTGEYRSAEAELLLRASELDDDRLSTIVLAAALAALFTV